jgi:hypothetical protein
MASPVEGEVVEPVPTSDLDSAYGDKTPSTCSLSSSMYDFEEENGRIYHQHHAGKYPLPNVSGFC